jgi:hypothetical protein
MLLQLTCRECSTGYEDVRNDKSSTNWLIMSYPEGKDELELMGSGSGGLTELQTNLKADQAAFGYLRMTVNYIFF